MRESIRNANGGSRDGRAQLMGQFNVFAMVSVGERMQWDLGRVRPRAPHSQSCSNSCSLSDKAAELTE